MTNSPASDMPFLDHLEELRWRLLKALSAFLVAAIVAFALLLSSKVDVIGLLAAPAMPYLPNGKLIFTKPTAAFSILMNLSVGIGIVAASPVVLYQAWAFLSPALYRHEKRMVVPVLFGATLLFLAGAALAFFVVMPFTWNFLFGIQSDSIQPMLSATEYFDFAFGMALAFGAVFELPILILALTALGIVSPALLNRFRRHAIVGCVVASAFITPGGDPTSLLALSVPLYVLYEISVVLSVVVYKRRMRKIASEESISAPAEVMA
jgi:sec-independent protein translocase protein TatC